MDRRAYSRIRQSVNTQKDELKLIEHLLQDVALVAAFVALAQIESSIFTIGTVAALTAAFIFRKFSLMHDAVHGAISKSKWVNNAVGLYSGAVCLLAFEPWKINHLEHHKWTGNIDKDPVTALITAFPKMNPYSQNTINWLWMLWFPILAIMQYGVFWMLALKQLLTKRKSVWLTLTSLMPVIFWTGLLSFSPTPIAIGLVSGFFVYLIAVEVVNFPHHLQLPQYHGETRFNLWDQHSVARTCIYPKWIAEYIVLNFNYHIEHHMYPDVPWYHLDKIHLHVSAELKGQYNTDPYFKWFLENKKKPMGQVLAATNTAPSTGEFAS